METRMHIASHILLAMTVLCVPVLPSAAGPPNVILFATDDLCDWVGPLGYQQAVTPNMDQLARNGMVFTNAHCQGTMCNPSRISIMWGKRPSS